MGLGESDPFIGYEPLKGGETVSLERVAQVVRVVCIATRGSLPGEQELHSILHDRLKIPTDDPAVSISDDTIAIEL